MLRTCAVLMLCLHVTWAGDRDRISFPEDIASPFVSHPEATSERYRHAVKALFEVVLRLKQVVAHLDGADSNFVVSPLCVAAAMGQLLLGARGQTRRQLADMLTPLSGVQLDEKFHRELGALLVYLQKTGHFTPDYALDVAGALFVQDGLPLRESFRYSVTRLYGSDFIPVNFSSDPRGSQKRLNDWASEHTRGHISTILPYPLPASTAALLANSVYFRGNWETPFDPDVNVEALFHLNRSHTIPVTLMRNSFEMLYGRNKDFSLVALPYLHKQAAMFIILPNSRDKNISEFISELSMEELHKVIKSVEERLVNFAMPKMTLSAIFSLREPLTKLQKIRKEQQMKQRSFDDALHGSVHSGKEAKRDSVAVGPKSHQNNSPKEIRGHSALHKRNTAGNIPVATMYLHRVKRQDDFRNATKNSVNSTIGMTAVKNSGIAEIGQRYVSHTPNKNSAADGNVMKTTSYPRHTSAVTQKMTTTKPLSSSPSSHNTDVILDMTGASDDVRFRVDDIIHQAWLDISETGTEATAVAATTVDYSGDSVVFLVNRPFLFFIRHEVTLAPLFWGVIADPTSGSSKPSHF